MASAGWERVGKPKKLKEKGAASSGEKRPFVESMPRIEPRAPVKESETIYDVLKAKEPSQGSAAAGSAAARPATANGDAAASATGAGGKPSAIPKLKKQTLSTDSGSKTGLAKAAAAAATDKKQPTTVEEVAKQLTRIEFETLLAKTMAIFPDSPHLWLKDMAGHLNAKFESVEECPDPVFEKQPTDYPMSLLPKSVVAFFVGTMAKCPVDVLQLFLDHCVQTSVAELSKGMPTYGYRMVVQILASKHPLLFTSDLQKHLDTILANKSHVLRCLTAMWSLGQCGLHSLPAGLRVWLDVMLPLLGVKALAPYAVAYIERLLEQHSSALEAGAGDGASSLMSPAQFFVIFDGVFGLGGSSPPSLTQPLHKRLQAVYPKLKAMVFANRPARTDEGALHKLFPSFVVRLPSCKGGAQLDEVMGCIITCLQKDREAFAAWMQMYRLAAAEHAAATSMIVKHIVSHWYELARIGGHPDLLKDAVLSFLAVNEELGRTVSGETARRNLSDCDGACKALVAQFESAEATAAAQSYAKLFITVLVVLSALVGVDLYQHGGFLGSKCEFLLRESHIACAFSVAQEATSHALRFVADEIKSRLPLLMQQTQETAEWLIKVSYTFAEELSRPSREWLQENVPLLLDWVVSHPAWSAAGVMLARGWHLLSTTLGSVWASVSQRA